MVAAMRGEFFGCRVPHVGKSRLTQTVKPFSQTVQHQRRLAAQTALAEDRFVQHYPHFQSVFSGPFRYRLHAYFPDPFSSKCVTGYFLGDFRDVVEVEHAVRIAEIETWGTIHFDGFGPVADHFVAKGSSPGAPHNVRVRSKAGASRRAASLLFILIVTDGSLLSVVHDLFPT